MNDDVIKSTQQKLNGHLALLIKGFRVGEYWSHSNSIRDTSINKSEEIQPLYLVIKDQKVVSVG